MELQNILVYFILFHKICKKCIVFLKNLHSLQEFYTAAGRDGRDKFQVCQKVLPEHLHLCEQLCQTEVDVLVVQQRSSERLSLPDCHTIIIFVNILLLLLLIVIIIIIIRI